MYRLKNNKKEKIAAEFEAAMRAKHAPPTSPPNTMVRAASTAVDYYSPPMTPEQVEKHNADIARDLPLPLLPVLPPTSRVIDKK